MQSLLKNKKIFSLLSFLIFAAGWELLARSGLYRAHLFPAPSTTLRALTGLYESGELATDLRDSFFRWGSGYLLGCLAGFLSAFLFSQRWIEAVFSPLLNAFSSIPKVVLIPISILWFGIGEWQKILLVAWGAFFPVWINLQIGLGQREKEYEWVADNLGLKGFSRLRHLILPQILPFLITGMRLAISTATFALAAAEMAGAFTGIAHRVFYSHEMFQTDRMMAGIVVISFFSWALNAFFQALFLYLTPWARKEPHS